MITTTVTQNEELAAIALSEAMACGILEFYVCPGARCAPLLQLLKKHPQFSVTYGFEERSVAFYALGRARQTSAPIAIVTTSGTAVGELLPAVMEAHYSGVPLLIITSDRPRRFRKTGAPQTADQAGIFGSYTPDNWDVAVGESFSLEGWLQQGAAHVNLCFEEPLDASGEVIQLPLRERSSKKSAPLPSKEPLKAFLAKSQFPWVIVGGLLPSHREAVAQFLLKLRAPVYLEGPSGLREDLRLVPLSTRCIDRVWESSKHGGYPIDGVLRIGHVPTLRAWRDLEDKEGEIDVLSISPLPFSGLSWGTHLMAPLCPFLDLDHCSEGCNSERSKEWRLNDRLEHQSLLASFEKEPNSEPSLIHSLSKIIPKGAHVYLGNSLPIREWDLAATFENRAFDVTASRGLNGIDGQISQFLGLSHPKKENWAILGDLTTLYDMAGPWLLRSIDLSVTIVTVNNGGGQIFSRMFPDKEFINHHEMGFKPLADLWGFSYEVCKDPTRLLPTHPTSRHHFIELIPDNEATSRFWDQQHKRKL